MVKMSPFIILLWLFSTCYSNPSFDIYQHVFSNTFHVPPPLSCNNNFTHHHEKISITLWDIDTTISNLNLLQIQKYEIKSECYLDFFGSEHKSIISKKKKPLTLKELQSSTNLYNFLKLNEEKTYHSSTGFLCKWLSTTIQTSIQYTLEKMSTYYNPDGTISGLHGYKLYEVDSNYYGVLDAKDLTGYLIPKQSKPTDCPPLYGNHYTAIRGIHQDYDLITIPEIQFQALLNRNQQKIFCNNNGTLIYRSEAGYLLSIPDENKTKYLPHSQISQVIVNPSYLTGEISYFLTKLTKETNETFQIIEEEICKIRQNIWFNIVSKGDINSLGQYFTGDLWSKTVKYHQDYKVYKRSVIDKNCTIPSVTQIINQTMLVICPILGTVYIHPYSNLQAHDYEPNLMIFDYLIMLDNGNYWDYQKQINISKLSMNHFATNPVILLPKDKYIQEDVQIQSIPELNTLDQYPNFSDILNFWKIPLMITICLFIFLLIPSIFILYSCCKKSKSLLIPV